MNILLKFIRAVCFLGLGVFTLSATPVDYARDIRPLLKNKCSSCHGALKQKAKLRLDAGKLIHQGGKEGKVIVPGNAKASELIERVTSKDEDERMPPEGEPLSAQQVALLAEWINAGAKFPANETIAARPEEHWSLQPVKRPAAPKVKNAKWPRNPIDHFILAKLEAKGWQPNDSAQPMQLLRRAHLDLIGLPPTLAEQDAYKNSALRNPNSALETLIDNLIARKGYGERYARHWLDVVRYADSNGYERDGGKPEVWRFRDYVIRALNADKPFDRFLIEQLAGDEVDAATTETILATGFNRLGPWDDEPPDFAVDRFDQLDDIVNTTSQAFLGLTMGCARCHDHKFDPLLHTDYYSMVAIFNPLQRPQSGRTELTRYAVPHAQAKPFEARDKKIAAAQTTIKKLDEQLKKKPDDASLKRQKAEQSALIAKLEKELPSPAKGYFLFEPSPTPPVTHLLKRGNPKTPGDVVPAAVPVVLVKEQPKFLAPTAHTSRRRLTLARWIGNADNPLTARVIVNRAWQWHFGHGLVRTPNDFGLLGEPPTHPELLDWLAHWFVHDAKWSLKKLHRLIMTSRAWRMSREPRAAQAAADPDNRLLWRMPYRRLEVEAIRDSMLFVSGQLDRKMFGPAMHPFVPRDALLNHADKEKIWPKFNETAASRRTIYAFVKRSLLVPLLEVLDLCDTTQTSPQRKVTTVPTQALTLYNGNFAMRQANHFAARLQREAGNDLDKQIQHAWQLALSRPPTKTEHAKAKIFVQEENLAQLCRVIFNLNEFVYSD
jgi:hypothetical protein